MTKPTGRPIGRPPVGEKAITKSLGSVRVSEEELAEYGEIAELENVSRADWIRKTLNKAAMRARKKHGQ